MCPMRQMPEGLPDERRGQQRKPKAQKRHGVHPVLCMHQGLSQKSAALKRCKPYITVNPIYKKNYGTREHRSFFMFSFISSLSPESANRFAESPAFLTVQNSSTEIFSFIQTPCAKGSYRTLSAQWLRRPADISA